MYRGSVAACVASPTAGTGSNPDHLRDRLTIPESGIDPAGIAADNAGEQRMAITVTQLHPHIGAEIGGLDLREPADAATVEALWQAIDRHAVLVFHDQRLSDEE